MKKQLIAITKILLIFLIIPAYFVADLYYYANQPASPSAPRALIINVPPGQGFHDTVQELYRNRLINHPLKFKVMAKLQKLDRKIIAGEYELSTGMTPETILEYMTKGIVRLHKLCIPEGYNLSQIAENIEKSEICSKEKFMIAASDAKLAAAMGIPATGFEGYLFPDTYYFSKGVPPEQIISAMVEQFRKTFQEDWKKRAEELGFTQHEIITLASMIEKETGVAEERAVVASVFHNRLKQNMRLASDPTVIYGIDNFNGNITKADLNRSTPYNTYRISGLPPGPIANPGALSIKAALYPAVTNYLYFVAKGDHTHYFSTTLAEHNRAVKKYQLHQENH
ncbi:MAG: endolytic transglycosylase MltG [Desulfosalsimonadaceae bacterium]|nr:endolytic transglycosylase MltG [Desulfosalsimonadaceae bacterium]